jgi:hypothetical protein
LEALSRGRDCIGEIGIKFSTFPPNRIYFMKKITLDTVLQKRQVLASLFCEGSRAKSRNVWQQQPWPVKIVFWLSTTKCMSLVPTPWTIWTSPGIIENILTIAVTTSIIKGSESHHLFENTVWVKFVIAYQEMDAAAGFNMYSTYITMHDASQQSNICKYGFPWFTP